MDALEHISRTYHKDGDGPPAGAIFVFGSNLAGRHGKGAALAAVRVHGARYGQGSGPQGYSYAIPTKGLRLEVLPLREVREHVQQFIAYAQAHPQQRFFVTRVGCGLAGNNDANVASLFADAPPTCSFALEWRPFLEAAAMEAGRRRPRP